MTRLPGILLISVVFLPHVSAQENTDLGFILKFNPIELPQQHHETVRLNLKETSELKLFSTGLIRIYQKFISTQDLPLCNFSPSCSRFGMGAIQKYGFFRGVLLTADRLLRDHSMIWRRHYHIHPHTGRYFDPIEAYSPEALGK